MQETFFDMAFDSAAQSSPAPIHSTPSTQAHEPIETGTSTAASTAELTRLFNAAILLTQTDRKRDFAAELYQLVESPAFEAILGSIRSLSRSTGMSERQAAEQVVLTFRKIDSVWSEYVFQEGVDRLRNPG